MCIRDRIITADHGCDPAYPTTDHTRERVPLLVWGLGLEEGVNLGRRSTFADVSATVLEALGCQEKLDGTSFLNAVVKGNVTKEQINAQMKAEATESFGYNEDEIVSSDVIGMRFGSLFDATQTMVQNLENGTSQVQVVSWYDNENSYVSQMVRTIKYFSELK